MCCICIVCAVYVCCLSRHLISLRDQRSSHTRSKTQTHTDTHTRAPEAIKNVLYTCRSRTSSRERERTARFDAVRMVRRTRRTPESLGPPSYKRVCRYLHAVCFFAALCCKSLRSRSWTHVHVLKSELNLQRKEDSDGCDECITMCYWDVRLV